VVEAEAVAAEGADAPTPAALLAEPVKTAPAATANATVSPKCSHGSSPGNLGTARHGPAHPQEGVGSATLADR